jgi:hypothetical protein
MGITNAAAPTRTRPASVAVLISCVSTRSMRSARAMLAKSGAASVVIEWSDQR